MAKVEKLSIALTPEMAASVRRAVEAGEYASASEVVRDALRDWSTTRARRARAIEELRRLVEEGIDSGPGRFGSIEEIIAEGRRQLGKSRRAAG
jgi:antitoxin ParD1/3/4